MGVDGGEGRRGGEPALRLPRRAGASLHRVVRGQEVLVPLGGVHPYLSSFFSPINEQIKT